MILLIDNYDSFTYNLYQFIGIFNSDIKVVRNDKITIEEIEELNPESIVVSPGPKSPKDAGICVDVIKDTPLIVAQYASKRHENSLSSVYPNLVAEWHPTKNGELKPDHVSKGSSKKI